MTAIWPNFILIGAAKSGTTSLTNYLRQHPQVFFSTPKEPRYFSWFGLEEFGQWPLRFQAASRVVKTEAEYLALFAAARPEQIAIGEGSVQYLWSGAERVATRIAAQLPQVRLIAILRQPADRAYSNYLHAIRSGYETLGSLQVAIEAEAQRCRDGWSPFYRYYSKGLYADQLRPYLAHFSRQQLLFLRYEAFRRDPQAVLRQVYRHLGIDESFQADTTVRYLEAIYPRDPRIARFVHHPHPLKNLVKWMLPLDVRSRLARAFLRLTAAPQPGLDPAYRQELTERYRPSILALQDLLGEDFSDWLAS
jgi:hypothetical protein